jgi:transcription elongation GreA/GreB family factor
MTFKEAVYNHCVKLVNDKIGLLQQTLIDLRESASNETKSTAGDKHETALAMLQIEQENTNKQLENVRAQRSVIERIVPVSHPTQVANGSLVKTNKGYLFISIALGKMIVDSIAVIALSPQSPLGLKLSGLKVNDSIEMNGVKYVIENIE